MEDFKNVGAALLAMRKERGLKQKELAALAGISTKAIYGWEKRGKLPQLPTLEAVLSALKADLAELFQVLDSIEGRPPQQLRRASETQEDRRGLQVAALGLEVLGKDEQNRLLNLVASVKTLVQQADAVEEQMGRPPIPPSGET